MDMINASKGTFLCHSSKDKRVVRQIASTLAKVGVPIWYDEWEIEAGDSITRKINDGLASASNLVVFLSSASLSSNWVQRELNSTLMKQISTNKIRIIPVKLERCEVPHILSDICWISLTKPETYLSGLTMLLKAVLPKSEAETAISKLPALVSGFFAEYINNTTRTSVYVSCPNCSGCALSTYVRKKDAPSEYKYDCGIQCQQCGMIFVGYRAVTCMKCNSPMVWCSQGGSDGAYGSYEDDYAWKCPECGNTIFAGDIYQGE